MSVARIIDTLYKYTVSQNVTTLIVNNYYILELISIIFGTLHCESKKNKTPHSYR